MASGTKARTLWLLICASIALTSLATPARADWGEYFVRIECSPGAGVVVEPIILWDGDYRVDGHRLRPPKRHRVQRIGVATYTYVSNRYDVFAFPTCRPFAGRRISTALKDGRLTIRDVRGGKTQTFSFDVDDDMNGVWSYSGPTFELRSGRSGAWTACRGRDDRPGPPICTPLTPSP